MYIYIYQKPKSSGKLKAGWVRKAFTTPRYLAIIFLQDVIISEAVIALLLYRNLWVLLLPIIVESTVF